MTEKKAKFTFQYLPNRKFPLIETTEVKDYSIRWSMNNRMSIQAYSFDESFQSYQKNDFVKAFFQDKEIAASLKYLSSNGKWTVMRSNVTEIIVDEVPCNVVSMSFFDKIMNTGVVRESGNIVKCFDEYHGDITIQDELRKMLLTDKSDFFDIFSEDEQKEFIFLIFRHLCIGGTLCQFDDYIQPYFDITKLFYKQLVSVFKDTMTNSVRVASCIFKVSARDKLGPVYPSFEIHFQDFSYFIVDPLKRLLFVFYHKNGVSLPSIE